MGIEVLKGRKYCKEVILWQCGGIRTPLTIRSKMGLSRDIRIPLTIRSKIGLSRGIRAPLIIRSKMGLSGGVA